MKRFLSLILAIILVALCAIPSSAAASPFNVPVLRMNFNRDKGPSVNGYAIDYSFYSPVKKNDDTTMYPLVVMLAGLGEGAYVGAEVQKNNFATWTSPELQNEFVFSHGAFILIARAPEETFFGVGPYWNNATLAPALHAAIEQFCEKHTNVDKDRIYGMGWCFGAPGIVYRREKYHTFAACVLMVPNVTFTDARYKSMKDITVWLIGAKMDSFSSYSLSIKPNWEKLCETADKGARIFTSYTRALNTDYLISHNVWDDATYNFNYPDKNAYVGRKTVDKDGNEIEVSNFIRMLSMTNAGKYETIFNGETDSGCVCRCHSTKFLDKVVWKVIHLLAILIGSPIAEKCECGLSHRKDVVCENPEYIPETTQAEEPSELFQFAMFNV